MVSSIIKEINLRKDEINEPIETIYFGGGTPSVLKEEELSEIIVALHSNFSIIQDAEITLEANPEDINEDFLRVWMKIGINRLSIGVQSFSDEILTWMNRNHSAQQSISSVKLAQDICISNISIDLIYGVHSRSISDWENELDSAIELNVPHISAYCLTVEEKTVFHHKFKKGERISLSDAAVEKEFFLLHDSLGHVGIEMYEVSNFSRIAEFSRHNSNYWAGKPYLGLGPGAHSFDGVSERSWNISNNGLYIKGIETGQRTFKKENLTLLERYNEHIMTGLRQTKGISIEHTKSKFKIDLLTEFNDEIQGFLDNRLLVNNSGSISLTKKGFMLADRIASDFFK